MINTSLHNVACDRYVVLTILAECIIYCNWNHRDCCLLMNKLHLKLFLQISWCKGKESSCQGMFSGLAMPTIKWITYIYSLIHFITIHTPIYTSDFVSVGPLHVQTHWRCLELVYWFTYINALKSGHTDIYTCHRQR